LSIEVMNSGDIGVIELRENQSFSVELLAG
jgi:hypothetical protein